MRTLHEVISESIETKQRLLDREDVLAAAQQVVSTLVRTYRSGGRLYLCGNGGSAADAQHFAAELTGHFIFDRPPLAAEALHGNSSHMTCVANDYDWDQVFARALSGSAREKDVLVCLSTSGNSANVVRAAEAARELGVVVVGFTGSSGGELKQLSDICVCVPSDDTGRIQEAHINLIHGISEQVEHLMFAEHRGSRTFPSQRERLNRTAV